MKKCENCKHGEDYGESVKWIKCERKKKAKYVEKEYICKYFQPDDTNVILLRVLDMV